MVSMLCPRLWRPCGRSGQGRAVTGAGRAASPPWRAGKTAPLADFAAPRNLTGGYRVLDFHWKWRRRWQACSSCAEPEGCHSRYRRTLVEHGPLAETQITSRWYRRQRFMKIWAFPARFLRIRHGLGGISSGWLPPPIQVTDHIGLAWPGLSGPGLAGGCHPAGRRGGEQR